MSSDLRTCLSCGAAKPLASFATHKNKKYNKVYVSYDCLECTRAAMLRRYYERRYGPNWRDHIEMRRIQRETRPPSTKQGWRQRLMDQVCSCERCGFLPEHPFQLQLHHRDGDRRHNERPNLAILCANCHTLVTAYQNACRRGKAWPAHLMDVVVPWCRVSEETC